MTSDWGPLSKLPGRALRGKLLPSNPCRIEGDVCYMNFIDRNGVFRGTTRFNAWHFDLVSATHHRWFITKDSYVEATKGDGPSRRKWSLHRLLAEAIYGPSPLLVDHRDGDPLNNLDDNLRYATVEQNNANRIATTTLGVKGVSLHPRGGYIARFSQKCDTEQEAITWRVTTLGRCPGVRQLPDGKWVATVMKKFDTIEEADAQYVRWAEKTYGEFALSQRRG